MAGKNRQWRLGEHGVAAVELAIMIPIFLLLIFAILEFGQIWYLKHLVTNASREGARFGIIYRNIPNTQTRQNPKNFTSPSIDQVVDGYLGNFFDSSQKFWGTNVDLKIGTGTTIPSTGNDLTVTVTAPYHWFVLGSLVPGIEDFTITAVTIMKLE